MLSLRGGFCGIALYRVGRERERLTTHEHPSLSLHHENRATYEHEGGLVWRRDTHRGCSTVEMVLWCNVCGWADTGRQADWFAGWGLKARAGPLTGGEDGQRIELSIVLMVKLSARPMQPASRTVPLHPHISKG